MSAYQDDMIAELQRANAVLRAERDAARAREAELDEAFATRNTQFDERLEHQTATIDVLKAMSASPGDPQPVFDAIVRNAALLCESRAGLRGFDGTHMRMLAYHGENVDPAMMRARALPQPPDRASAAGRAILERRVVHIPDLRADPEVTQTDRKSVV